MKKFVLLLGAAAIAVYGTFSLVSALQKDGTKAYGPAATGGVVISPAAVHANSTLQLRLEGRRGPGADPGVCRWFVNDTEVAGITTSTLEPAHFKKGDSVRGEVTVDGTPLVSATVVVANTPPRITHASAVLNEDPTAEIVIKVAAVDADDDPITYTYEWFKNGQAIAGQTESKIDVSHFQKGDNVFANVVATDGQDASSARRSDPIKLGSNAPKITSTPPQALGDGREFIYQVRVASGSSSLKYELIEAPEGMSIDSDGRIEWTVPLEETADGRHEHKAVVKVTDPMGGYSTQEFRIATLVQASTGGE